MRSDLIRAAVASLCAAALMAGVYFGTFYWQRATERAAQYEQRRLNANDNRGSDAYQAATVELWRDK